MRIVIIGNGVAGIEAALAVRARQRDWSITIISEESEHFFSRTALMWVMSGQLSYRDIEPFERDLYERAGFTRVRARAQRVDAARHVVRVAGGPGIPAELPYDRLLLACGSRPRRAPWPGADARGVGHFVTLQDLAWLEREVHTRKTVDAPPRPDAHISESVDGSPYRPRPAAADARGRKARRAAILGGGLIGIEAVEVCHAAGLATDFFIREEWFWPMAIDPRESAFVVEQMREHGVRVHLQHEIVALEHDGAGLLTGILSERGRYPADLAVVAIGVTPNTGWLGDSAIARDEHGGILVDRGLATSADDVFAAGDCASVYVGDGARRPEQLWYTAREQGRVAGRRLLGEQAEYRRGVPYNSAKLMDLEYTTAGTLVGAQPEHSFYFEEQSPVRSTTRIVTRDDAVVGFNFIGRRWNHGVLIAWIEQRRSLDWVLAHLDEAAFDTELVPPLRIPETAARRASDATPHGSPRGA